MEIMLMLHIITRPHNHMGEGWGPNYHHTKHEVTETSGGRVHAVAMATVEVTTQTGHHHPSFEPPMTPGQTQFMGHPPGHATYDTTLPGVWTLTDSACVVPLSLLSHVTSRHCCYLWGYFSHLLERGTVLFGCYVVIIVALLMTSLSILWRNWCHCHVKQRDVRHLMI